MWYVTRTVPFFSPIKNNGCLACQAVQYSCREKISLISTQSYCPLIWSSRSDCDPSMSPYLAECHRESTLPMGRAWQALLQLNPFFSRQFLCKLGVRKNYHILQLLNYISWKQGIWLCPLILHHWDVNIRYWPIFCGKCTLREGGEEALDISCIRREWRL